MSDTKNDTYWDLIAAALSGNISDENKKKLEDWRRAGAKNEQLFNEAQQIWEETGRLKRDFTPNTDEAWKTFKKKIKTTDKETKIVSFPNWLKMAAVIALIIGIGLLFKLFQPEVDSQKTADLPNLEKEEKVQQITVETTDSIKSIFLPDSSSVKLNLNTKLTYLENYNDTNRWVNLSGEALFDVQKSEKDFRVYLGEDFIRVTGTSFNVNAKEEDENITISVISGEVEYINKKQKNKKVKIEKDETLTVHKPSGESKKEKTAKEAKWWKKATDKVGEFINKVGKGIKKKI